MDELTADPHAEIARLEELIEQLEVRLESCRKFAAASRFAMTLGGVLLLGLVFGVIPFDPLAMTAAIAARADLIGSMALRVVGGRDTLH